MIIPIKLLSSNAKVPVRAKEGDAGYDLFAAHGTVIQGGDRALIQTDIAVAIPRGWYGRIAPRSGLALKQGIAVLGGVCDASYRGPVGCILINHGRSDVTILRGERIAQLIIERCAPVEWQVVEDLDETARGGSGFGSTDERSVSPMYRPIIQITRDEANAALRTAYAMRPDQPFNPLDHEQTK